MRLVVVESPYAGKASKWWGPLAPVVRWMRTCRNVKYARAALRDCLVRGEAPFASHLLYTQPGVLRDHVPAERAHGIEAGFAWAEVGIYVSTPEGREPLHFFADRVIYSDRGVSSGMRAGIDHAEKIGQRVVWRPPLAGWSVEDRQAARDRIAAAIAIILAGAAIIGVIMGS
jgi:hypothetical protein